MKKNKTRLFRHFITILHICALSLPIITLSYNVVSNALNLHFASQSVQHHGGSSDVFSNDLSYAVDNLEPTDLNTNIIVTLDNFNYLTYTGTLSDWSTRFENEDFTVITDLGTSTHLFLDFDYVSLFKTSSMINHDNSVAPYLFLNFYINYMICISVLLFLPQFLLWFFDLIYKIMDKFLED